MTQEQISAAMDALHNDLIEVYKKHKEKIAEPDDTPLTAPGGSHDAMAELNRAKEEALREIGGGNG